jgi:hypothetical protein
MAAQATGVPDSLNESGVNSGNDRWELVNRVIASVPFQRSRRLRELLLYICEHGMQNRPEELREQLIGHRVLGRQPDYNPAEDNIVRVEVRMLRKRLEEYFSTEGKDEPVVITIPKGSYMPCFQPVFPPASSTLELEVLPVGRAVPAESAPLPKRSSLWLWIQPLIIGLLAAACLWMWQQGKQGSVSAASDANTSRFWSLLFNKEHQTSIICADSSLVVAQTLLHRSISLEDYLSRDYAGAAKVPSETAALLQRLQRWQYTNISDARLVQRLSELNASRWGNTSIRSARTAQIQDFKNGNVILIGSPRSNPWASLFEQQLNFRFDRDERTDTPLIRNKAPLPGEQASYRASHPGEFGAEYSLIALVPNLRGNGNVLLIAGASGESTEAAGEFIANRDTCSRLLQQLGSPQKGHVPYFEALLQSNTVADVARSASIVSVRILPDRTSNIPTT